jgi:hypothetical protein
MPLKWRLRLSRILRIVFTASKLLVWRAIADHLPGGPDLNQRITTPHIDRIVTTNAIEIDDVPEIPTDEYIDASEGGDSNVLSIDSLGAAEDSLLDVAIGQFSGLLREFYVFPIRFCYLIQDAADRNGRCIQFETSEVRQNDSSLPGFEEVKKSKRGSSKLGVQAATDDRRIRVDSSFHVILTALSTSQCSARRQAVDSQYLDVGDTGPALSIVTTYMIPPVFTSSATVPGAPGGGAPRTHPSVGKP